MVEIEEVDDDYSAPAAPARHKHKKKSKKRCLTARAATRDPCHFFPLSGLWAGPRHSSRRAFTGSAAGPDSYVRKASAFA